MCGAAYQVGISSVYVSPIFYQETEDFYKVFTSRDVDRCGKIEYASLWIST